MFANVRRRRLPAVKGVHGYIVEIRASEVFLCHILIFIRRLPTILKRSWGASNVIHSHNLTQIALRFSLFGVSLFLNTEQITSTLSSSLGSIW